MLKSNHLFEVKFLKGSLKNEQNDHINNFHKLEK